MSKRIRWRATAALFVALVLILAGCGASGGASSSVDTNYGTPVDGGELRVGFPLSPSSLDPIRGGAGSDHVMLYPIYDRLVNFTSDMQPAPGLAESYEYPSPQTLVLHLVKGVTFHDGTPFNAEAVKFNLDRARSAAISNVKAELASIADIQATDESTVTITLSKPDTSLPLILADRSGMMVSPTVAQQGDDALAQNPVGTGPFKFVSFAPGDSLILDRNTNYWGAEKPHLDRLSYKFMTNPQTLVNAISGGQVDIVSRLNPQTHAGLKSNSSLVVSASTSLGVDGCYVNATMAPTDNLKIRQAIAYAVDYEGLKKSLTFDAGGEIATALFPKDYWAYPDVTWPYKFDLDKAKQLVAESGISNPEVNAVSHNGPGEQRKLEILQGYLQAAGIKMNITIEEVGTATKDYTQGSFQLYCSSWTGRPDPSMTYNNLLSPTGFFNGGKYSEPGVEQKLGAGNEVADPAQRRAAFESAAQYASDTLLFIPMVFVPSVTAYGKKVQGYIPDLYGKPDLSFLWIDESKK